MWRASRELTLDVYRLTESLPGAERYGLVSQLRRAAVSIGSNIAEGTSRRSPADFARFLEIAAGSASEVEHLLTTAVDLEMLASEEAGLVIDGCEHIRRMLIRLRLSVFAEP